MITEQSEASEALAPEEIPPRPWHIKALRITIAAAALLGVIGMFVVQDFTFFQRTPDHINQPRVESKLDAPQLSIPLTAFIVRGEAGGSRHDVADVDRLVDNANNIWSQANIQVHVVDVVSLTLTAEETAVLRSDPVKFLQALPEHSPHTLHLLLPGILGGSLNGVSFGHNTVVAVADFTSGYDWRTFAHEVGHQLGLEHTTDTSRVMSPGAAGVELTLQEIVAAREAAEWFTSYK